MSQRLYRSILKRCLDLAGAVVAITALAPIFVVIVLIVRLKIGTPILFRQPRPGLHGKPFTLYKFRTMTDARDAKSKRLPDAARLTRLGKLAQAMLPSGRCSV